jgi:hypothetical protein
MLALGETQSQCSPRWGLGWLSLIGPCVYLLKVPSSVLLGGAAWWEVFRSLRGAVEGTFGTQVSSCLFFPSHKGNSFTPPSCAASPCPKQFPVCPEDLLGATFSLELPSGLAETRGHTPLQMKGSYLPPPPPIHVLSIIPAHPHSSHIPHSVLVSASLRTQAGKPISDVL